MIPMTLKHQNWVEPLSGSKQSWSLWDVFMDIISYSQLVIKENVKWFQKVMNFAYFVNYLRQ